LFNGAEVESSELDEVSVDSSAISNSKIMYSYIGSSNILNSNYSEINIRESTVETLTMGQSSVLSNARASIDRSNATDLVITFTDIYGWTPNLSDVNTTNSIITGDTVIRGRMCDEFGGACSITTIENSEVHNSSLDNVTSIKEGMIISNSDIYSSVELVGSTVTDSFVSDVKRMTGSSISNNSNLSGNLIIEDSNISNSSVRGTFSNDAPLSISGQTIIDERPYVPEDETELEILDSDQVA
jgi:hypothetical protein